MFLIHMVFLPICMRMSNFSGEGVLSYIDIVALVCWMVALVVYREELGRLLGLLDMIPLHQ